MPSMNGGNDPGTDGSPIVLRWPDDRLVAEQLARRGVPRLLLVDAGSDPPVSDDPLEDWLRLPATDGDVRVRAAALTRRARGWSRPGLPARPVLDGHGRLLRGATWVTLSPVEEQLMEALLEQFDEVVDDGVLCARGWPDGGPSVSALRLQLMRLRRRISGLGLEIRTVRGRGYVLQSADSAARATGSDTTSVS